MLGSVRGEVEEEAFVVTKGRVSVPTLLGVNTNTLSGLKVCLGRLRLRGMIMLFKGNLMRVFNSAIVRTLRRRSVSVLRCRRLSAIQLRSLADLTFSVPTGARTIVNVNNKGIVSNTGCYKFLQGLPFVDVPASTSDSNFSDTDTSLLIRKHHGSIPTGLTCKVIISAEVVHDTPRGFLCSKVNSVMSGVATLCS